MTNVTNFDKYRKQENRKVFVRRFVPDDRAVKLARMGQTCWDVSDELIAYCLQMTNDLDVMPELKHAILERIEEARVLKNKILNDRNVFLEEHARETKQKLHNALCALQDVNK